MKQSFGIYKYLSLRLFSEIVADNYYQLLSMKTKLINFSIQSNSNKVKTAWRCAQ